MNPSLIIVYHIIDVNNVVCANPLFIVRCALENNELIFPGHIKLKLVLLCGEFS